MTDPTLAATIRAEIETLHVFLADWFTGRAANSNSVFQNRFRARFDDALLLIPPGGEVLSLERFSSGVRANHGMNPPFKIEIRNVSVRRVLDDHVLATYEEWQQHAKASKPANNARVASVLFRLEPELKWVHIHETWLPRAVMEAGPYDF